jgi:hypothetical protein
VIFGRALIVAATVFYRPRRNPLVALWFYRRSRLQCWPLLASVTLPAYYLFFPMAAMGERGLFQNPSQFCTRRPVWAWLLWRRIHDQKTQRMNNAVAPGDLSIGVVIPVKNEAAACRCCLRSWIG